ncbi:MAG: hypothetical protein PHQ28_12175 [Mycobacterium sp.]|nr:hypothetical protein [Mycobacterium sp.]
MAALAREVSAIAKVLEGCRTTALRSWDKEKCDIYHVATRAWRAQGSVANLTGVIRTIRRVVPDGNVLAYNDVDGRTREQIAEKFVEARLVLLQGWSEVNSDSGERQSVAAAQR